MSSDGTSSDSFHNGPIAAHDGDGLLERLRHGSNGLDTNGYVPMGHGIMAYGTPGGDNRHFFGRGAMMIYEWHNRWVSRSKILSLHFEIGQLGVCRPRIRGLNP